MTRDQIIDYIDEAWRTGKNFRLIVTNEGNVTVHYGRKLVGYYVDPGDMLDDLFPDWNK